PSGGGRGQDPPPRQGSQRQMGDGSHPVSSRAGDSVLRYRGRPCGRARRRLEGVSGAGASPATTGSGAAMDVRTAGSAGRASAPRPRNCGSRASRMASSGEAMKIDEYAPEAMPTISANAKSFNDPEPKMNSSTTGI